MNENRERERFFMKPYSPAVEKAEDWIVDNAGKMFTLADIMEGAEVDYTSARYAVGNAEHWAGYKLHRARIRNTGEIFRLIVQSSRKGETENGNCTTTD